jgi:hypothetical protein
MNNTENPRVGSSILSLGSLLLLACSRAYGSCLMLAAPEKFESKRFCSAKQSYGDFPWCILSSFFLETTTMRTRKLHFPDQGLPTLETFLKQTKEAHVFCRVQAVRAVVEGHRLQTVSALLHFPYSALRTWVHRFASQGVQGLVDRPRPGRP